jgi:hypothetical protein
MLNWTGLSIAFSLGLWLALFIWYMRRLNAYRRVRARVYDGIDEPSPMLESMRRASMKSGLVAGFGSVFGFMLLMNAAARLQQTVPVQLSLPSVSLPAASHSNAVFALLALVAIEICWVMWLRAALRGGPDWQSGLPGDPIRLPRWFVIVGTLVGLIVLGPVMAVLFWTMS